MDPGSTEAPIPKFIDARPVVEDHRLPRSREKREDKQGKEGKKEWRGSEGRRGSFAVGVTAIASRDLAVTRVLAEAMPTLINRRRR